jgi:hypothetical protein
VQLFEIRIEVTPLGSDASSVSVTSEPETMKAPPLIDIEPVGGVVSAAAFTVTDAVPLAPLDAALIVNGPPALDPAVNTPPLEIVPPPLAVQAKAGLESRAEPN